MIAAGTTAADVVDFFMALLSFRWIQHPEPTGSRRATPTSHFQQRSGHPLRDGHYREQGFETVEDLLLDWERDHLTWDANDLLHMLWSWQRGDISANPAYGGDIVAALGAIRARAIVAPCSTDLYFPPDDNAIEVGHMPCAELRVFDSPWGHCVASPGERPEFNRFIDDAMKQLLAN